jgi:glutathione S-transferase
MSNIRVTAFNWVPPFAQGLVRDLRVRWALEEAGLPYTEKLIAPGEQNLPAHRAIQPFGQVPVYEEDGLTLFETGSIVMHIAERCPTLLPVDPAKRARARTWMFAALNSVEQHVQNLTSIDLFFANEDWARQRRPGAEKMAVGRLDALVAALTDRDYLEEEFSAGDLLMATVLRLLRHTQLVPERPVLAGYLARCEARPAFQRALAAQLAPFAKHAPAAVAA